MVVNGCFVIVISYTPLKHSHCFKQFAIDRVKSVLELKAYIHAHVSVVYIDKSVVYLVCEGWPS